MSQILVEEKNKKQTVSLAKAVEKTFKKGITIILPNAVLHSMDSDFGVLEFKLFLGIWQGLQNSSNLVGKENVKDIKFSIDELNSLFGISDRSFEFLDESMKKILRVAFYYTPQKNPLKKSQNFSGSNFISSYRFEYGKGLVISVPETTKSFLYELSSNFIKFPNLIAKKILSCTKTSAELRLYFLLKRELLVSSPTIFQIPEIKKILGLKDDEYSDYKDFKRYVLTKAQTNLNDNADLNFKFIEHKEGKKVEAISFEVKAVAKQLELPYMAIEDCAADAEADAERDFMKFVTAKREEAKKGGNTQISVIEENGKQTKIYVHSKDGLLYRHDSLRNLTKDLADKVWRGAYEYELSKTSV